MEFEQVVRKRRMVRTYSDRAVPADALERVLALGRKAPSAGFSQGQSFVVLDDPAVKSRILAAYGVTVDEAGGLWAAPVHIVVCTSEKVYRDRYTEPDKILPDGTPMGAVPWPVPYWFVDAGASMLLLLLAAVDEGLSACFFGLPDWEPLKKILDVPEHVSPVGIVSLGYGDRDEPSPSLKRGWKDKSSVVHFNRWSGPPVETPTR